MKIVKKCEKTLGQRAAIMMKSSPPNPIWRRPNIPNCKLFQCRTLPRRGRVCPLESDNDPLRRRQTFLCALDSCSAR